jgi:anti-sigma factor RsiW
MLTCRQITELVTDLAEGNLSLADRIRFQLHIGMCRSCRRYVRQVKATAAALGKLPPPELPPDLELELLRRFETWKGKAGA